MSDVLKDQIMDQLAGMSGEEQRRILEIARSMSPGHRKEANGGQPTTFRGVSMGEDDAHRMSEAIEAGCER